MPSAYLRLIGRSFDHALGSTYNSKYGCWRRECIAVLGRKAQNLLSCHSQAHKMSYTKLHRSPASLRWSLPFSSYVPGRPSHRSVQSHKFHSSVACVSFNFLLAHMNSNPIIRQASTKSHCEVINLCENLRRMRNNLVISALVSPSSVNEFTQNSTIDIIAPLLTNRRTSSLDTSFSTSFSLVVAQGSKFSVDLRQWSSMKNFNSGKMSTPPI